MTDRELLELAAKAAGYQSEDREGGELAIVRDGRWWPWNPLTDDGDALRLAVDLGCDVCVNSAVTIVYGEYDFEGGMVEDHGSDARAATRRAIVRAAAEQAKDAEARG